jgi:predicted component of type VI protein secretion system
MGKLVLHLPDGTVQDILLGKECISIGRRSDNDVCLPYPAVSSEHARVVTVLNDSFLEDLGSTNGTLVNGQRILKHLLRDNDQIDIGRQRLVYFVNEAAQAEPLPPDVRLRDLEGLRDQVQRARTRRTDNVRRMREPQPVVEDDELLADLEQAAAPAGAERAVSGAVALARNTGGLPKVAAAAATALPPAQGEARRSVLDDTVPLRIDEALRSGAPAVPAASLPVAPFGHLESSQQPARPPRPLVDVDGRWPGISMAPPGNGSAERASAGRASAAAPSLWVRVIDGASAGRVVPLTGDEFVLGRVGEQVARLVRRDGTWTLMRVEGAEPLLLNGAPVAGDSAFVAPGDRFVVAGTELEVERR